MTVRKLEMLTHLKIVGWDVPGSSELFWDVLRCCLGCSVGYSEMLWDVLGCSGMYWDLL